MTNKGRFDDAIALYRKAIELSPNLADAHNNLGFALNVTEQPDEAIAACRQAIRINPNYAEAYINLGNALQGKGQLNDAITCYRQAVNLRPDLAQAHSNLGNVLMNTGQIDDAIVCHQQAIRLRPDLAEAHYNLGIALEDKGKFDEAIAATKHAIELKPDYAEAHTSLGNSFVEIAHLENAIACYREAIRHKPNFFLAHSNLICTMNFHLGCDSTAILREARKWNDYHGKTLRHLILPHKNRREPDRRLRVGYVSAYFREFVLGWNLLPLLSQHDRGHFEIFGYSSGTRRDAMTDKLRGCCDQWREVANLSDERLASQIRADEIDILIDLSLHSAKNRLRTFAMAPAPVQITYLAYCGTSGVDAMNYRFSDPYLDPPEQDLSYYSEQTIRLPETYWCYSPGGPIPDPSPLPADQNQHITFGSMNQFSKVSSATMELWCEIMKRTPGSRMLIHAPPGEYLNATRERFNRFGVSSDRVEFVNLQPWASYISTYHQIDIGLDPFPFNGGITTCDTLLMGVPVVSLSGQTPVGRGGRSILSNIGHPELVAYSSEHYVNLGVALAGDLPRLRELRKTLRQQLQSSPLMDAPRFARNVEAAYRQAWRNWCTGPR